MIPDGRGPEEQVRLLKDRLGVVSGATTAFAEATADYQRLLAVIAQRMAELLQSTCTVQILSADGASLSPVALHATDPIVLGQIRSLLSSDPIQVDSHALYRQVLDSGEPLLVPRIDPQAHRRAASAKHGELAESLGIHSGLMVALRVHGHSIGTLSLGRYDPALPPFEEADRELAQTVAVHAALAITNARLLHSLREELSERRKAEEQLRHAQKMEAIGQLAGGVAHDFNNLLSVVLSYTDLLLDDLEADHPRRVDLQEVRKAGQRGEELTRQLLAFSRRQVLEPVVLDLNQVVEGMEKMVGRLLGASIQLTVLPAQRSTPVRADPGQLEQVVMNLAVNARDAMPQGGKLTFETALVELDEDYAREHAEVTAGPHVMLAVSDTGVGMDKDVQARIFEPFFTTKGKGRGTGLGLSTVFGIVKQSGGHLWVYSEPGMGTTFKVYLPRAEGAIETNTGRAPVLESVRGTETLLLVEDDDQVRVVARDILRRYGYRVLEAHNGGEALLICEQHPAKIHLLLTDVVLPRLGGRELAERLQVKRPEMKVLFMSGYADEAIFQHGILESGVEHLQKPLTPERLSRRVREVLAAAQGSASATTLSI